MGTVVNNCDKLPSLATPVFLAPYAQGYEDSSAELDSMGISNSPNIFSRTDSNDLASMGHSKVYADPKSEYSGDSSRDSSKGNNIPDESFELSPGKVALIQATEPIQLHIKVQRTVPDFTGWYRCRRTGFHQEE